MLIVPPNPRRPFSLADGALIRATGVTVNRGGKPVIDKINLAVHPGEILTLVGPNGAGKTTLINAILNLIKCDGGLVEKKPGLVVGYVPQQLEIDSTLPIDVRRFLYLGTKKIFQDLELVLEEVGFTASLTTPVQGLSGGELRRVLLARALIREPELLVLDEPTAGIDYMGQGELYKLIRTIRDRRNCGILLVSHNLHLVMAATDHVICLNTHVCCEGKPDIVSCNPAYIELFGEDTVNPTMAFYTHKHDHRHDHTGAPVPVKERQTHGDANR